jgi:hypothetical protein
MKMFRRLLKTWRRINYYAAHREATAWTRMSDAALVLSFVLAVPATWMSGLLVERHPMALEASGALVQPADSIEPLAWIADEVGHIGASAGGSRLGSFRIEAFDTTFGWPFVLRTEPRAAKLYLDMFRSSQMEMDVAHDPGDRNQQAIAEVVRTEGEPILFRRWQARSDVTVLAPDHSVIGWIGNTIVWWVMLLVLFSMLITTMKFLSFVAELRHVSKWNRRRKRNQCLDCGYDLHGLDFNERCPECGALVEY